VLVQLDKDLSLSDWLNQKKVPGVCVLGLYWVRPTPLQPACHHDRRAPILLTLNRMLSPTGQW